MTQTNRDDWTLVCHLNYGKEGKLVSIKKTDQGFVATPLPSAPAIANPADVPVFLGLQNGKLLLMNQVSKAISESDAFPVNADPSYAYPDYANQRLWFVNDGDEETGNNELVCSNHGSPVTVLAPGAHPKVLGRVCVGRGHHCTAFVPARDERMAVTFVSNLLDGSIFVLGNDEDDSATYLKTLASINLGEANKEESGSADIPNNAFPHGLVYSAVTDRVYNLNNGYGTIAVLNPDTYEIDQRISMKKCSNLLLSPCQRFAVGKGADRKVDPDHVIGRISIVDLAAAKVAVELDVQDIYPSTYRFSPDGSKLYVTTAATGKGTQKANLKMNKVLVYDTSKLPAISLIKEIDVGIADCGRRPLAYTEQEGKAQWLFIPNSDGTLTIIDGRDDSVVQTVTLGEVDVIEALFSFWDSAIRGS